MLIFLEYMRLIACVTQKLEPAHITKKTCYLKSGACNLLMYVLGDNIFFDIN